MRIAKTKIIDNPKIKIIHQYFIGNLVFVFNLNAQVIIAINVKMSLDKTIANTNNCWLS